MGTRSRHSTRLPGYDYSAPGWYYVTLTAYKKEHLFGSVGADEVVLSKFGRIVNDEWLRTRLLRPEIVLDAFVVMPNHFHGIVAVRGSESLTTVGAHGRAPRRNADESNGRPPRSLGSLVAGFKSAVTVRINALRDTPRTPVWQRNYYDHVIRDEAELRRIRRYIRENPAKWAADPDNAPL